MTERAYGEKNNTALGLDLFRPCSIQCISYSGSYRARDVAEGCYQSELVGNSIRFSAWRPLGNANDGACFSFSLYMHYEKFRLICCKFWSSCETILPCWLHELSK